MIRLDAIQEKLSELYEKDSNRFFVEASGASLEVALASAAIQLGTKARFIDYEVIQKGKSGFFAIVPKDWKIIAYKNDHAEAKQGMDEESDAETSENIHEVFEEKDVDGQAFICCFEYGVFLKVTEPSGKGSRVKIDSVIEKFKGRNLPLPSESILMPIIKEALGKYVRVSDYNHNAANDAIVTVNISEDEMAAYIYVVPPGPGGADVSAEQIGFFLKDNNVTFGYDEQKAINFQDNPVYKTEYLIAEGRKAQNGKNAYMEYHFEEDPSTAQLQKNQTMNIDFRQLNLIQNVVEGEPLAVKIPAERGVAGSTVTGRYLEAENGKDLEPPLGENTYLSEDGLTILAGINGHVTITKGKVTVEPVLLINGDVSLKTGNIEFLGSVIVTGNIDDGFSVRASGNIEIKGIVGKCDLDAEGDIIIGQGVIGKEGGSIRTSKSIWAKFIQSEKMVYAGENVIVTDGILNSDVMAKKTILCNGGRRPDIIGGNLSATELIAARNLGSQTGGNETVLNVGFDPEVKERVDHLNIILENDQKALNEANQNVKILEDLRERLRGKPLPKEKEELLQKNLTTKYTMETEMSEAQKELEELKEYLNTIKAEGRVSASGTAFTGVTINIKNYTEILRTDSNAVTFRVDKGLIRYGKYEKPEQLGGPSGYSAD